MLNVLKKARDQTVKGSPRDMLEDLFQDFYEHRYRIYQMNFFRGVFFGFGSLVGATILVTILLWVLSFAREIPFLSGVVVNVQHSIQAAQQHHQ